MSRSSSANGQKRFWCVNRFSLAEALKPQEREELERYMQHVRYGVGETIYFPGDPSTTVYTLHHGRVRLDYLDESGRRLTFAIVGPGQVFGETALVGEERRRWIAEALEDTTLCIIHKSDLLRLAEHNAKFALSITKLIGDRMLEIENKLENLLFRGVKARLARALVQLAETYGQPDDEGMRLRLNLTHEELAHLIGSTRETTSATLGKLEREGLLAKRRGEIVLKDLERLRELG